MQAKKHGNGRNRRLRTVIEGALLAACAIAAAAAILLPPSSNADGAPTLSPTRPTLAEPAHDESAATASVASSAPETPALSKETDRTVALRGNRPCPDAGKPLEIDLNHASLADLERLPGIGPAKASRIIEWRTRRGPFRRIRDLRRIKGFGRKTVERLAPFLVIR